VPVRAVYYDPIHDFGFLRYSPGALQFMQPEELELYPAGAVVGADVRVVGNDSGEKLSILSGIIARVDRDAPNYGANTFNDFNIHYIQAASGTKGGSSGSPVLEIGGRCVALNAGSKNKSAAAFYVPLHRIARALALIQAQMPLAAPGGSTLPAALPRAPFIPRGCLLTTLLFKGFDDVRRLGLSRATEAAVRRTGEALGMLTVDSVLPGGPADDKLLPGDVLVMVNNRFVQDFTVLEELLDDHVGGSVQVVVERGGISHEHALRVADLHAVTPARYLECWGGVLHDLSYQVARHANAPLAGPPGGCYIADVGYVFSTASGLPRACILTKIAGAPIRNVDDAALALAKLNPEEKVPIEWVLFTDRKRPKNGLVTCHSRWYGPLTWMTRNDTTGLWDASHVVMPTPPAAAVSPSAKRLRDDEALLPASKRAKASAPSVGGGPLTRVLRALLPSAHQPSGAAAVSSETIAAQLRPSFVLLTVNLPPVALLDGVHGRSFRGTGLIIRHGDAATHPIGLILTDRNTVPVDACDITASFAASPAEARCRIEFLHPTVNIAIVSYDVRKLPVAVAAAAQVAQVMCEPPLALGDAVHLVGISAALRPLGRRSHVTDAWHAPSLPVADAPRFRTTNTEVIELDDDFGGQFAGVLADVDQPQGPVRVRALWASFSKQIAKDDDRNFVRGIHARTWWPHVEAALRRAADAERSAGALPPIMAPPPPVWLLDVELAPVHLAKAGGHGLSPAWVAALAAASDRCQALRVVGLPAGSRAREAVQDGDFILTVGGCTITCCDDLDSAVKAHVEALAGEDDTVAVTLWRDGKEVATRVRCTPCSGLGTQRLIQWAGAQIQAAHRSVRELGWAPGESQSDGEGLPYISRWHHGSPAHRYGLYALVWITSVNGTPTPDLDSFLAVVRTLPDGADARLMTVNLHQQPKAMTMKMDAVYWPTVELRRGEDGEWHRTQL
jgi:S1-C subfamily serine protease